MKSTTFILQSEEPARIIAGMPVPKWRTLFCSRRRRDTFTELANHCWVKSKLRVIRREITDTEL